MHARLHRSVFSILMALTLTFFIGFHVFMDPLSGTGTPVAHWYSHPQMDNPLMVPPTYSQARQGEYDSFLIGAPSASAYPLEELNAYTGKAFYHMTTSDNNPRKYEDLADYVIRELNAKNIILNLGIQEATKPSNGNNITTHNLFCHLTGNTAFDFYAKFLLSNPDYIVRKLAARYPDPKRDQVYDAYITGTSADSDFESQLRDWEKIGDMDTYWKEHADSFGSCEAPMADWERLVSSVRSIKELCDANGVDLTVVCAPVYENQWEACPRENMTAFKTSLAQVTDFWDFSHSSLSYDSRFFHDNTHMRSALGSMILARIYGDQERYLPDDFGIHVTKANVAASVEKLYEAREQSQRYTQTVPVLMYHHFEDVGNNGAVIATAAFERHMRMIAENGYHSVTFDQLNDYVRFGTPLPEKPVCITIDDGYLSNYEIAYPILEEYGLRATIFPIGHSMGATTYKDTGTPITPHFTWEQAVEMQKSGVIDIQCHTFDMHQTQFLEQKNPCRSCACPVEGETKEDFTEIMNNDLKLFREQYEAHDLGPMTALAYPTGRYTPLTEVLVHRNGIPVTLSTANDRPNVLVQGLPQSLYALCRLNVTDRISDQQLIDYLDGTWNWK